MNNNEENYLEKLIYDINILIKNNRFNEIIKTLQKAIKDLKDSSPPELYLLLATAYKELGKLNISEKIIRSAIIKNPNNLSLLNEFKNILKETKKITEYVKISKIVKSITETIDENWEEALKNWKIAKEISPNLSLYNYILFAKTCEMNDEWELHKDIVQEGLKLYPQSKELYLRLVYNSVIFNCNNKNWDQALKEIQLIIKNYRIIKTPIALNYLYKKIIIFKRLSNIQKNQSKSFLYNELSFRRTRVHSFDALSLDNDFYFYNSSSKFTDLLNLICKYIKHNDTELDEKIPNEISNTIVYRLSKYDYSDLTDVNLHPYGWKFLSFISTKSGYLKLGWTFKKLMMHSLENLKANNGEIHSHYSFLRDQILLSNENGDTDYFNFLLKKASDLGFVEDLIKLSKLYHGLYSPDDSLIPPSDHEFSKLINKKNIAVVGPIDVNLNNGDEIDCHDTVIRLSFNGIEVYDKNKFGTRTDISYYTINYVPILINKNLFNSMNKLKSVVFHHESFNRSQWINTLNTITRKRYDVYKPNTNPFLCGFANAIQRVLMDILRFNPNKINVFNANLFLTDKYATNYGYTNGYIGTRPRTASNLAKINGGLSFHEPSSNFIFLQKIYQNGYIQVDSVLKNILSMHVEQYIDSLEKRYGVDNHNT